MKFNKQIQIASAESSGSLRAVVLLTIYVMKLLNMQEPLKIQ